MYHECYESVYTWGIKANHNIIIMATPISGPVTVTDCAVQPRKCNIYDGWQGEQWNYYVYVEVY